MKTNVIYCGDCKDEMEKHIPDDSIDLIYLDPPFFSNKKYEVIWGDGYEIRSFEDRWKGGIENYIGWMEDKLRECHRVLKSTGSIYLHCDYHAGHYLKVLMDRIFGINNFRNEIVWITQSKYDKTLTRLGRKHDVIFFYTKSNRYVWNRQYTPLDKNYIEKAYTRIDKRGRFKTTDISAASGGPTMQYAWKGFMPPKNRYWAFSKKSMQNLEEEGRIYYSKTGKPYLKTYLNENKGIPSQDVWDGILPLSAFTKERLGYPTQKPEILLERIIKASSNKGDVVLDPMCGCGTAIAVAQKLGRKWIGIDVSPTGCKLMQKRMKSIRIGKSSGKRVVDVEIIDLPRTLKEIKAMQPDEFLNWVSEKVVANLSRKKSGDMGIDGRLMGDATPIQIKQSEHVGRNVVDNFETAIRREKKKKGMIIAFSFSKGAHEEVARAKNKDGLDIELKTVKDILDEI